MDQGLVFLSNDVLDLLIPHFKATLYVMRNGHLRDATKYANYRGNPQIKKHGFQSLKNMFRMIYIHLHLQIIRNMFFKLKTVCLYLKIISYLLLFHKFGITD